MDVWDLSWLWEKQQKGKLAAVAKGDPQADKVHERVIGRDGELLLTTKGLVNFSPVINGWSLAC
jgi:hypothetical protein